MRGLGVVGAALAGVAGALAAVVAQPSEASAADLSDFDAGYIISDKNFYDSDAMTTKQIQTFLNKKVPTCHEDWSNGPGDPIVCLKNYSQKTTAKASDSFCKGYSVKTQTAAQIINGVARSCGVSQKVLLVLLQKETGLITHTYPSEWRYERATGFACPDTAPCDTQYEGFFNQLYNAARQYKIYQAYPKSYGYVSGATNLILYHPSTSCGRKSVYIANQATAGLYIYTPYTPNKAALDAGYGTGNSCSSYGNRNFFNYYSDWFGSPVFTVAARLTSFWTAEGGADGPGYPVGAPVKVGDGVYQEFQNAILFRDPTGATASLTSTGAITTAYLKAGGPSGSWGWPAGLTAKANGIWRVPFAKLTAYNLAGDVRTAKVPMADALERAWYQYDRKNGAVAKAVVTEAGAFQKLAGGYLYLTADGTTTFLPTRWAVTVQYLASGGPTGSWGWPRGDRVDLGDAALYSFDNAEAYSHDGSLVPIVGDMLTTWRAQGGADGPGYPVSSAVEVGDGVYQEFQNAVLVVDPDGAVTSLTSTGAITVAYLEAGGPAGRWGWPTGTTAKANGIWRVPFTGVTGYNLQGDVRTAEVPMADALERPWYVYNRSNGAVADAVTSGSGTYQELAGGYLYLTADGTTTFLPTRWAVTVQYLASGGPTGSWGWPRGDRVDLGDAALYSFDNAEAYSHDGSLVPIVGDMLTTWRTQGGAAKQGYPVSAASTVGGGVYQAFQRSVVFLPPGGGTQAMTADGTITTAYLAAGGPAGSWGWPTGAATKANGIWRVPFTARLAYNHRGDVRTAKVPMEDPLEEPWYRYDRSNGAIAPGVVKNAGSFQQLAGGYLYVTKDGTSTFLPTRWAITAAYLDAGGPTGEWGWPRGDRVKVDGVYRYKFQHVFVYASAGDLTVVAR